MSELPDTWTSTSLQTVANLVTGNTPSTKSPEYYGGHVPFVKPGDLDGVDPIAATEQQLTELGAQQARLVRAGATLVSCIGNLGKVGFAGVPLATNQQINSAEFHSEIVDDRYGYHFCKTMKPWMERESSATTIAILNKGKFGEAPFPLAPLAEQKRIADKLDTVLTHVDAINTRLTRVAPLLKRFRQSVLAAATSGRLTADWGESEGEAYKKMPMAEIAEMRLGKMLDKAKNTGVPVRYLRNVNVRWFGFELSDVLELRIEEKERDALSIRDGDLLICEGGEPGRCAVWQGGVTDLIFQKALHRVRPNPSVALSRWLAYVLKHLCDSGLIAPYLTGSTIKHLTGTALAKLPILLPKLYEQAEIVRRVDTLFAFADRLEARLKAAEAATGRLTPALLTKAFRGELVPQDPDDEPASELLRRLQAASDHRAPARAAGRGSKRSI